MYIHDSPSDRSVDTYSQIANFSGKNQFATIQETESLLEAVEVMLADYSQLHRYRLRHEINFLVAWIECDLSFGSLLS